MELDVTSLSSCALTAAPSDCSNGGLTYMMAVKLLDENDGTVFTTVGRSTGTGPIDAGIRLDYVDKAFEVFVPRQAGSGTTQARRYGVGTVVDGYVNTWLHVTLVWNPSNLNVLLYYNGQAQTVTHEWRGKAINIQAPEKRLKLGVRFLSYDEPGKPGKNMVLDDFKVYNRPLTQAQVQSELEGYVYF